MKTILEYIQKKQITTVYTGNLLNDVENIIDKYINPVSIGIEKNENGTFYKDTDWEKLDIGEYGRYFYVNKNDWHNLQEILFQYCKNLADAYKYTIDNNPLNVKHPMIELYNQNKRMLLISFQTYLQKDKYYISFLLDRDLFKV